MPSDPAFLNVGSVLEEGEMGEQKTFSPKLSSSVWMSREVGKRRRRRIWREGGRVECFRHLLYHFPMSLSAPINLAYFLAVTSEEELECRGV